MRTVLVDMKQLFRVLLTALPWLVLSSAANADPITTTIIAIITSIGVSTATATAVASFILNTAFTVGLSLIARAMTPTPDNSAAQAAFSTDITTRDPIASRRLIYGTVRVPGTIVYIHPSSDNLYHHYVVVLGQGQIDSVPTVYFNDEALVLDGSGNVTTGTWASNATIIVHTGATAQTADTDLITASGGEWTTNHRGQGIAYLYVKLHWTSNLASMGLPNITAVVKGRQVYDPRTSTTAYSANPALVLRDYLTLSAAQGGAGYSSPTGVDDANIIAQANICDTTVALANSFSGTGSISGTTMTITAVTTGTLWVGQTISGSGITSGTTIVAIQQGVGGVGTYRVSVSQTVASITITTSGTEKLYEANGVIELSENTTPQSAIQQILASCAGTPDPQGGTFKFYVGSWRGVVASINESNLTGPIQVVTNNPGQTRFNAVKGQYLEPASRWTAANYPAITSSTFQTEDGGAQVFSDLPLPMTTSSSMAQRLAKITLYRHRLKIQVQITCSLQMFGVAVGDIIGLTFTRYGWSAKSFEVIDRQFGMQNDQLAIVLSLRETSSAVYSWSSSEEQLRSSTPTTSLPDWRLVNAPSIALAAGDSELFVANDGTVVSRMKVSITGDGNAVINQWAIQWKRSSDSVWGEPTLSSATSASATYWIAPIDDATNYDVRVRAQTAFGSVSDWGTVSNFFAAGKSTPPVDVATIQLVGGILSWSYPSPPPDFSGFRIKYQFGSYPYWANAGYISTGLYTSTSIDVTKYLKGSVTLMVKAVDTSGNESINAAIIITNLGDYITNNLILTTDLKAAGFPGTINSGSVVAGNLVGATLTYFWQTDDTTAFWQPSTTTFWTTDVFGGIEWITTIVPSLSYTDATMSLTSTLSGEPYAITYRTGGGSVQWPGKDSGYYWGSDDTVTYWISQTDWLPWPGSVSSLKVQSYEIKTVINGGAIQPVVSGFSVLFDVPTISETISGSSISAGGTRLAVTKSYRSITGVNLTIQGSTGGAVSASVEDKLSTGPLVKVLNSSGTSIAGSVDAIVQGY